MDGRIRCLLVHAYISYHALLFEAPFETSFRARILGQLSKLLNKLKA